MNDDKTCAFFRRAWWDTAHNHLSDSERLALYEGVFAYQFDNKEPQELPPMVAMLFDLIKPVLTADRDKMQRRAETARANGMSGGRPKINNSEQIVTKPSGLNENPAGFFGLPIYNYNMQDTISNNNVCPKDTRADKNFEEEKEDTHTKFFVSVEFFLMGVDDPVEEGRLFWNYYDARGWKTGDGQQVKNVLALAKSWHPKNMLVAAAKRRSPLRSLFNLFEMPDFSIFERLSACEIDNSTQTIFLYVKTRENAVYFEERHINALSKWVKATDKRDDKWILEYKF